MQNRIPERRTSNATLLKNVFSAKDIEEELLEAPDFNGGFISETTRNVDRDPFLNSLENLIPDDIAPPKPPKKRTIYDVFYSSLRYILLMICAGVFVWSVYTIAQSFIGYRDAENLYGSLADDFDSDDYSMNLYEGSLAGKELAPSLPTPDYAASLQGVEFMGREEIEVVEYNEKFLKMKSKLNNLSIINSDLWGWIKIDNTVINYPIMQSDDNDYYLDHSYEKNFLSAGSIFADYRNYDSLMKNFHVILYGHNMRNGQMFNNVMNYLDEDFFRENPYIEIYTFDGIYTYEVFAIYETRYDYDYIRTAFPSWDEFLPYCEKLRANSMYEREGVTFEKNDRLLTLSTCTNNVTETGRYALHAKLVKREK